MTFFFPAQSLDYEICDNELYQNDTKFRESHSGSHKDFARWILFILIGILTALVACFIDIVIDQFSILKYSFLKRGTNSSEIQYQIDSIKSLFNNLMQ